ncbi:MAG TPA: radical SAM protein [Acidobacteriota bacterium]|nr:radical SAM protein [Acidobacteriota bacterium]
MTLTTAHTQSDLKKHLRPVCGEHPLFWMPEPELERPDPAAVFAAGLRHHHLANTAYPIAHRKTIWPFRQDPERHRNLLRRALAGPRLCLYVHVPFCERRCAFCEYTVLERHDDAAEAAYFAALEREVELYLELLDPGAHELAGLDVGGGTPLLARPARIGAVLDRILRAFPLAAGFAMSIETTPKIAALDPDRLAAVHALGFERISMGLQTVNPELLRAYARDQAGYNRLAADQIRRAGFRAFNIDLMYGFAHQTVDDFAASVRYAIDLAPDYITLYRMRYKGTRVAGEAGQVDLDRINAMYHTARELLLAAGYAANPGKNAFSRIPDDPGTSRYLTERVVWSTPYLGLGLGAQTFTNTVLGYNLGAATKTMGPYLDAVAAGRLPLQDLYHLPPSEGMAKMIAVSFYFGQIHREAFRHAFGRPLEACFPEAIAFVLARGLMEYHGPVLRLTPAGAAAFNGVIALFYSPRVQAHLLGLEEE